VPCRWCLAVRAAAPIGSGRDGVVQAATPLVFWWLDSAIVYALGRAAVAAIYIGFAVTDGRVKVIAVESGVAFNLRGRLRRRDHRNTMAVGRRLRRPRV
jgi:hypothetical protein